MSRALAGLGISPSDVAATTGARVQAAYQDTLPSTAALLTMSDERAEAIQDIQEAAAPAATTGVDWKKILLIGGGLLAVGLLVYYFMLRGKK